MSGMRQKIQYSLALEPAHQGETPVGGCQGTEPVVAKPAPQSPALASTPCRCPSLTPSNRRVRDPYARWCGRGGTARCPPIPIFGAELQIRLCPGGGPSCPFSGIADSRRKRLRCVDSRSSLAIERAAINPLLDLDQRGRAVHAVILPCDDPLAIAKLAAAPC